MLSQPFAQPIPCFPDGQRHTSFMVSVEARVSIDNGSRLVKVAGKYLYDNYNDMN